MKNSRLLTGEHDKKPFKGKGVNDWLSRLQRDYDSVINEMRQLSKASRQFSSLPWHVFGYQRTDSDQFCLIWRSYGAKQFSLTWDKVMPYLGNVPSEQRVWVLEAQAQMLFLSAQEQSLRFSIKNAKKCLEATNALAWLHDEAIKGLG